MGYIYKIVNNKNNKVYIGLTIRPIQIRWEEHLKFAKDFSKNTKLYRAMRKYGINSFSIEIVEKVSDNLLNEKEKYYISKFDSYYNGYNSTLGGEGTCYIDFSQIEKLFLEGKNLTEISKITGHTLKSISQLLRGHGYNTKSDNFKSHPLGQGNIICFNNKNFTSQRELAKYLIETFDIFKNNSLHSVEKGISKSIKTKKPYKGFQF